MIGVGYRFSREYQFTRENIADYATRLGDGNPLHHDAEKAAASRFGGIIASGPHSTAILMGFAASHISEICDSVGLDFDFRLKKAIRAGTQTIMSWTVTGAEDHAKLKGKLLTLEGRIEDKAEGHVFVSCNSRVVIWPQGSV